MLKRSLRISSLLLLLLGLTFTACEKEEITTAEEPTLTEDFTVTERGMVHGPDGRIQCYKLIFPVNLAYPDGTIAEDLDADELKQALRAWKENNPNAEERPHVAFPYDVELKDGTIATIETDDDVQELRQDCRVSRPHRPGKCFKLIYPVTVNFSDNTAEEVGSGQELHQAIKAWKEENPDAEGRPELAFPYQVELRNGGIITVESGVDVRRLPRGCRTRPKPPCFQLNYPLSLVFPGADGITVDVANISAMHKVIKEWKENYPNAEGRPEILFPYDVRLRDGTIATIENEEDLQELRESCGNDRPERPKCFKRTFPLTLEYPSGRTETVENRVELHLRLWKWKKENPRSNAKPQVTFPCTVVFRDGTTATVNNREELDALRESCN